jgi:hypothetical protein
MRGGTFSNRDSSAAGSASPTSRSGPQQQAKTLLLRRRAGVASCRRVEQAPLVLLQAGAGRSGKTKSLLPQQPEEMLVKVSPRALSERSKNQPKRGYILKAGPLFSFRFCLSSGSCLSSFSSRQELCTELEWEFMECK